MEAAVPEPSLSLGAVALVVLVIYLLVLLSLGVIGYLRSRNTEEDFYLAGRGQGMLVTVMTIMATFFSSAAILGIPGQVYKEGTAFMLFAMNLPCAGACIYLLGSKIRRIGRRRSYVTQGDMISEYYGDSPVLRLLVALIGFLYVLPYVIMQIKAGGYLAQVMFPETRPLTFLGRTYGAFELGASALSLVTMVYVLIGGMRSVAWTDVLQGFLLILGMVLASFATIKSLGGFGGFFEKVRDLPPEALALPGPSGIFGPWKLMTICLFASVGSLVQPAQWIRLYAARDDQTLKRSALIFSIVLPACFLFGIMIVALGGRVLYPPLVETAADGGVSVLAHPYIGETDQVVIVMVKDQLPAILGSLGVVLVAVILIAVLAASMSTADSNLHALSAVFTRDVYDRLLRPKSSERERAWVGRIAIVTATLLALWLVNQGHHNEEFKPLKLIADLMFAAIAFSTQLLPATIDMLFIRKGTKAGVMSGMVAGIFVVFLSTPFIPDGVKSALGPVFHFAKTGFTYLDLGCAGFLVNVVVFAAVSVFTPKLDSARVQSLAKDMR